MPGLIKVGKTTRLPLERIAELSGVTGVATPFVLAFEQYFEDCDAAEQQIHDALSQQGLREAKNREFFRASPNEVIRVVLSTPGHIDIDKATSPNSDPPWKGIFEEAEKYD